MSADRSPTEFLRTYRWTIVTILLVSLLVVLLLFGAVTAIGMVGTDEADPELPATRLTFTEGNATITDTDRTTDRTVVEIAYRSGTDVVQGRVAVRVNDQTAWDVRQTEDEFNATVAVWDETSALISEEPIRVVVYGDGLQESDIEGDDVSDRYSYLSEGDVIEVVWYGENDETMIILQRYVVGQNE